MAPPGKHVMSCFVQYAPYHLAGGDEWDDERRQAFRDTVIDTLAERAPNIRDLIVGEQVLSPLERGADRPLGGQHLPGRAVARAALLQPARARLGPLPHAGSRPLDVRIGGASGGGLMGAPGRIAALEHLRARGRQ